MKSSCFVVLVFAIAPAFAHAAARPATKVQIELVREAMQDRLKDADSAKFRNVRFGSGENKDTICGDINAKNSYGAYGGYVSFMAVYIGPDDYADSATVKHKASVIVIGVDDDLNGAAAQLCAQKGL